jgi:hypothetical protein
MVVLQICSVSRMSNMSTIGDIFKNNAFVNGEEDPETDALMDYADWLNSKLLHGSMEAMTEDSMSSQKTKLAPLCEERCNSTDVSDDSDSTVPSGCGTGYRQMFQDSNQIRLNENYLQHLFLLFIG